MLLLVVPVMARGARLGGQRTAVSGSGLARFLVPDRGQWRRCSVNQPVAAWLAWSQVRDAREPGGQCDDSVLVVLRAPGQRAPSTGLPRSAGRPATGTARAWP
jgi:hypothetical protein